MSDESLHDTKNKDEADNDLTREYCVTPTSLAFTFIAGIVTIYFGFLFTFMFRDEGAPGNQSRTHSRSRSIAASLFGGGSRASSPTKGERVRERPIRHIRPPALSDLSLHSTARSNALTKSIATEIRSLLPPRLQVQESWHCIYNLDQHGVSLGTLYAKCHEFRDKLGERPGFIVVVRDEGGAVFGAFVNEYLRPTKSYYGNGECFLYKTQQLQQGGMRFKAFPWTGLNDYQMYCTAEFMSIGGGDGKYGLWLDDRLEKGLSATTLTFGNEALSEEVEEGRPFGVETVEIWKV